MLRAEIVDDLGTLERLAGAWDGLAVAAERPFTAPGWLLSWWRHAAPEGAELRTVAVFDGDTLAGLVPLFAERRGGLTRYRLLGSGVTLRVEPLVPEGAAAVVTTALAAASPAPDLLSTEGVAGEIASQLAAAWPGRAEILVDDAMPAPTVDLANVQAGDWLASRSSHFRKRLRAAERKLNERGGTIRRVSERGELPGALRDFTRLHHERWRDRGGSAVLDQNVEAMLAAAATSLGPERLQVWLLEAEGEPVAAEVMLAAGGEVGSWLGGFADAWRDVQPSLQLLVAAIEDARRGGARRFDLGGGGQDFKYRLADSEDELAWATIVPRGRGYLRRRARLGPGRARRTVARRLPEPAKARLRRVLHRGA